MAYVAGLDFLVGVFAHLLAEELLGGEFADGGGHGSGMCG